MEEGVIREGRSLEVTPTWSVATVTTVMVFVCLFVERSIYRFGKVSQINPTLDPFCSERAFKILIWTFWMLTVVKEDKEESPICFLGED